MVKRKWLEEVEVEDQSLSLLNWLGLGWIERPEGERVVLERSPETVLRSAAIVDGPPQDLKEGNYEVLSDLRKA